MFRRLRALASLSNLESIYSESIDETKDELLDLLRSQLSHGESGDGQLPAYASESYAKYKQKVGSVAPNGITDLKLSGAFQNKLRLIMTKRGARIRSYDKKASVLMSKYGKEIYSLNGENISIYINRILFPVIINKIKNELRK